MGYFKGQNKGLTVSQLLKFCEEQVTKGNGEKHVHITTDDEGNGYHTLFFQFTDDKEQIEECIEYGMFHDEVEADKIVLLG